MIHRMKMMASPLPNDPKQLQAIILQLQETLAQQESVIATLRHQLAVLKRARFGRSSEHLDKQIHQLELQLEELEMQTAVLPALTTSAPTEKSTPRRRVTLPAQLPREELRVDAACQCPACQGQLTHIGDDVSEMQDVVPASYRVIRIALSSVASTATRWCKARLLSVLLKKDWPVRHYSHWLLLINTSTINRCNVRRSRWNAKGLMLSALR